MFAISYDSHEVLRRFAEKYDITYPLLSDEGSDVIRKFGILNTRIPPDHKWSGVPYPGVYMVGKGGLVFDKSFIARHDVRESVNDMLQESFQAEDLERGDSHAVAEPYLKARAYFASATIRQSQLTVLTVEISLRDGIHIYGRPSPEEYTPVELSLDQSEDLLVQRFEYPEPQAMDLEALDERLFVYTGRLVIRAYCMGTSKGQGEVFQVNARLHYQACDDSECYLPQTLTFPLSLRCLPHVR